MRIMQKTVFRVEGAGAYTGLALVEQEFFRMAGL